jgi:predicted Zn-ribbon and HTH transcriptional regulator
MSEETITKVEEKKKKKKKKTKGKPVKCKKCGYRWITKTKLYYATCPRCRYANKIKP